MGRLEEALALLRQAREHADKRGLLDSEGRTLVAKAIKLLRREGLKVDWKDVRGWEVERVDKLIAKVLEVEEGEWTGR